MELFRNRPLKQKFILISLLTTTIAMLVAGGLMFASEFVADRESMVADLTIKAETVGNQCSAALLFNDRKDAEETLSSLRADPDIEYAAVFTRGGALFAQFDRSGKAGRRILQPQAEGYRFEADRLVISRNITLRNRRVGSILISSNLQKFNALLLRYLNAAVLVLSIALGAAYILVSRLQRSITRPVTGLVSMMQGISRHRDFSLRAAETGVDELGALARGFNEMLSTIQDRDRALEAHRRELERTISDLENSTEELREANRKLKELDKLKSDFITVASHELRTPVTSIKAYVELLLTKPNLSPEKKNRILSIIDAESDRLARLIKDLLDLSMIESGNIAWRFTDVSLDDVIRDSLAGIMPLAENKAMRMESSIEPGLPPLRGDRDRLVQVVTNLLTNAVKFTPPNGLVHVSARREAGPPPRITVSVTDTGTGIPEEDLKIIFDKFQRSGDHLTSAVEGTGLGLAIAREIVEFHGGTIWAESSQGKGSTFSFTLPLERENQA
ncbi:MAG TPA: ATP-binding protein [Nitrospirota bacterium]|nr:ATP-binding protein [Nitrospirota bacterium]